MELDIIDRKIVGALMKDASIPIARLAKQVGLSSTPCWKRVQKLTEAGVLQGRVAVVDFAKAGFALSIFVAIEAPDHTSEWHRRFVETLGTIPQVLEAHRLAGAVDYMLRIAARDMEEFDAICREITDAVPVRNLTSQFAVEVMKRPETPPWSVSRDSRPRSA